MGDMGTERSEVYDVAVIGGGAAGLNAALLLARARRRVAVIDAGRPRNERAAHLHGFLSRDGLEPGLLLRLGREEVRGYGGTIVREEVARVDPGFYVTLVSGPVLRARRLLVATGLTDGLPDVPGLAGLWGTDVNACPYCHGWEVRDRPIGVIATEPMSALHAQLLRQWTDDLVFFSNGVRIDDATLRGLTARGIRVVNGEVSGVRTDAEGRLSAVDVAGGAPVPREALFLKPRADGNSAVLTALGCTYDENGLVRTDASGRTDAFGVWAAGNVADPSLMLVGAAAAGAKAAGAINMDLVEEEVRDALDAADRAPFSAASERTAHAVAAPDVHGPAPASATAERVPH